MQKSTIIARQLPITMWYDNIGEALNVDIIHIELYTLLTVLN